MPDPSSAAKMKTLESDVKRFKEELVHSSIALQHSNRRAEETAAKLKASEEERERGGKEAEEMRKKAEAAEKDAGVWKENYQVGKIKVKKIENF